MLAQLEQDVVLRLTFSKVPVKADSKGKFTFKENQKGVPYIVYDTHRDAPRGFGVKVGRTSKSYIVQRRVGQRVTKIKIGNVSDYPRIADARVAAQEKLKVLKETGRNPNVLARETQAADMTLDQIFQGFREYLEHRNGRPAKPNTLLAYDKARKRLALWSARKASELDADEIIAEFAQSAKKARTATEQCFRWASRATAWQIEKEGLTVRRTGRAPSLTVNPFAILSIQKYYRDKTQLRQDYEAKGVRNPMSLDEHLGPFINALWDRRRANGTGCDYLLLMLLWGCRKSEHAPLKWRELLTGQEAAVSSWADLKRKEIFLYDTKNRRNHRLPLAPCAVEILKRRQESAAREEIVGHRRLFVFPAESKYSKTGHYSNASSLLDYIRQDAQIERLTPHDLRRTFGRVAESLEFSDLAIKRLLNHAGDVTSSYTDAEWKRLRERMKQIEDAILATAPRVYNAVKPAAAPPIHDNGKWARKPQRRTTGQIENRRAPE